MRHLNLLFQGGGVKGIAYAGVMAELPADYRVDAVAGTSAGAIVAAFVALGRNADELRELLSDPKLFSLLSNAEVDRARRIELAIQDTLSIFLTAGVDPNVSLWRLWRLHRKHKKILTDVRDVWNAQGLHSSDDLRGWLDVHLGDARFEDVKAVHDLKIVAADVTKQQFKVYEKRRDGRVTLADAVHASASIPLFFVPFLTNANREYLVDGGLLSNYPSFVFAQSQYPTIGFRFSDVARPPRIASTWDYLKGLLFTMVEAHDKFRGDPPHFISHEIHTTVPTTKFNLTAADATGLYNAGRATAKAVDWLAHSSEKALVSFYDERPHEVLQSSLTQAFRLLEKHATDTRMWVETLDVDADFTVWIEKDWTVRYVVEERIKVGGGMPLFCSRLQARWDRDVPFGRSLADLEYEVVELVDGEPHPLIHVPAFNKETSKGLLLFYTPPIADKDRARTFRTEFSIPCEFDVSLGRGKGDALNYAARQIAHAQTLMLTVRVLADTELRHLSYAPDFASAQKREIGSGEFSRGNGRQYRGYEWMLPKGPITHQVFYKVAVE